MKKRLIILKFESSEDFCRYYEEIQQKRLLLPTRTPVAHGTLLVISLIIPMVNRLFSLEGSAGKRIDSPITGIQVNLDESFDDFIYELDTELSAHDEYAQRLNCAPFYEAPADDSDDGELSLDLDYGRRISIGEGAAPRAPEGTPKPAEPEPVESNASITDGIEMPNSSEQPDPSPAPAAFEWIREVVSHQEYEIEAEEPAADHGQALHDKKDLTAEERQRVEPVGQFIMNLTKAILRSGYYDPKHPGAVSAKHGLYEEFQKVLFDTRELMITKEETREHVDFLITGVLDLPVTVRTVVGQGKAELFAPKLHEYFAKKELLSLAVKKEITTDHFEKFIDIMSDPKVDRSEDRKPGQILTDALVADGISEISAVFFDDRLNLEKDLPWRVEMAMHRLAKDLKLLPMFKGTESDLVSQIKQQSIQDIIRPLKHPKLLNDFLVNCYIIAQHIENMKPREIEQIIVDSFPIDMLLPTSNYTFEELDRLNAMKDEYPDSASVDRRLKGIKRILKMVARRVVLEKAKGGQNFLAHLYDNQILSFEELPADAQYVINTREMARDVKTDFSSYAESVRSADDVDDIIVFLKCFRRIMPLLIEDRDWRLIADISDVIEESAGRLPRPKNQSIDALAAETVYLKADKNTDASEADKNETVQSALDYVFMDQAHALAEAYELVDPEERKHLAPIFDCLGYLGVETVGRILANTPDRQLRGHIVNWLTQKKAASRKWAHRILKKPNHKWYLYRNAMLILREVSDDPADADSIRPFLDDTNARLRLEALNVISSLKPKDLETLIIAALGDSDSRINWQAVKALGELPSISTGSMQEILDMLTLEPPDPENASTHFRHVSLLISTINGLRQIPMRGRIESDIIRLGEQIAFKDKKWRQILKRVVGAEDASVILKAAIPLLGRIGGTEAEAFLKKLSKNRPDLSTAINEALESIQKRA